MNRVNRLIVQAYSTYCCVDGVCCQNVRFLSERFHCWICDTITLCLAGAVATSAGVSPSDYATSLLAITWP